MKTKKKVIKKNLCEYCGDILPKGHWKYCNKICCKSDYLSKPGTKTRRKEVREHKRLILRDIDLNKIYGK